MPQVVPVVTSVVGAIAANGGIASVSFLGLTGTSALVGIAASSFALSSLQSSLASRSSRGGNFQASAGARTQQIQQPITPRRFVYGEVRVSGPVIFPGQSDDNEFLHLVIALADHEIDEIGEVWLNDISIPNDYLDGDGNVTAGHFDGHVRIKKYLGSVDQLADDDLVSEIPEWTNDHRLRGVAYIYIRLKRNRDLFPTGVPNVSAWVKGKKLYDPRAGLEIYSPNVALMGRDFLLSERYGAGADLSEINDTQSIAAANICDEFVTTENMDDVVNEVDTSVNTIAFDGDRLCFQTGDQVEVLTDGVTPSGLSISTNYYVIAYQRKDNPRIQLAADLDDAFSGVSIDIADEGTGTHTVRKTAEPRYHGGGSFDYDVDVGQNLRDILSGMGGKAIYVGGLWSLLPASYRTPVITLDESHLRAAFDLQGAVSLRDKFNTVKGTYVSPLNDGQPADYPSVTNLLYRTQDGGVERINDLDLPVTQRPHTGQRIAKIMLEDHRQELVINYPCNLHALQLQVGDTVMINNTQLGWAQKVFEVQSFKLAADNNNDAPVMGVDLVLKETASAVYDWNSGEETRVDPAPNTNLPDPFTVTPPLSLAVFPEEVLTASGDPTYKFVVSWAPHLNGFVTNGGQFEVQFKKTNETSFRPSYFVDGSQTMTDVNQVQPGINYDVRIRAVNSLGVRSPWSLLTGFTISSPSGATIQQDYGRVTETPLEVIDYGRVTDPVDNTLDYGDVV